MQRTDPLLCRPLAPPCPPNALQFLLSMGPFTGHKNEFLVDHKDDAVRWVGPPSRKERVAAPPVARRRKSAMRSPAAPARTSLFASGPPTCLLGDPWPCSGALVLEDGELRWPAPPLPPPAAPPKKAEEAKKKELTPEEIYADTLRGALTTSEARRRRVMPPARCRP